MSKPMRKISVSIPEADYLAYEAEAKMADITITEWARRKIAAVSRPEPRVLDEAFRRIDESDSQREFKERPKPTEIYPLPSVLTTLGVPDKKAEPHSCVHHAVLIRYDGGAPKVCSSSFQEGRPCYFPAAGARDCPYFHPARPVR
jgi:hypothetical protein